MPLTQFPRAQSDVFRLLVLHDPEFFKLKDVFITLISDAEKENILH